MMDMNIREKSDMATVPEKAPNKRRKPLAEVVAGSAVLKGNIQQFAAVRTKCRGATSRVRTLAQKDKNFKFTALMRHVTVELLQQSDFKLNRDAALRVLMGRNG